MSTLTVVSGVVDFFEASVMWPQRMPGRHSVRISHPRKLTTAIYAVPAIAPYTLSMLTTTTGSGLAIKSSMSQKKLSYSICITFMVHLNLRCCEEVQS